MKKQHKYSKVRSADTTPPPPLGWCYLTQHTNTQFHVILSVFYILSPIFLRSCDCTSWQILIIKPSRCTNFSNLFWNETLHVSDNSFVHHQEFFTVQTAMVYVIQVCRQLASRIRMEMQFLILLASCQQTCMTYTIAVCTVKNSWWWTEELSETCGVSFQNKFEKLVHLLVFIIRILSPILTLILLMWNIGCSPNNVSKWQMGINSAFKGLNLLPKP
jgi:hypothetical protein